MWSVEVDPVYFFIQKVSIVKFFFSNRTIFWLHRKNVRFPGFKTKIEYIALDGHLHLRILQDFQLTEHRQQRKSLNS